MAHRVVCGTAASWPLLGVERPQPGHRAIDVNDPGTDSGGHRLFAGAVYNMMQCSGRGRSQCRNKLHDVASPPF